MDYGIKNSDLKMFGKGLHPFQDSWSHRGIPGLDRGYAHPDSRGGWRKTHADLTHSYPRDAENMAENTYKKMLGFRLQRGDISAEQHRKILSKWSDVSKNIQGFINARTPVEKTAILKKWGVTPNADGTWEMDFDEHPKKD